MQIARVARVLMDQAASLSPTWHNDTARRTPQDRQAVAGASQIKYKDDGSGEAWNVNLNNGKRNSNDVSNTNNKRALCVRRS